ncbi:MAG: hypothetical protein AAGC81_09175 [Pseudomonadota bacterium]
MDRYRLINAWLEEPDALIQVAEGTRVTGRGLARACQDGTKIGPVFADDPKIASGLLADLTAGTKGMHFIDIPQSNSAAVELAKSAGLEPVFETARMHKGPAPRPDLNRTFGITTFEFG